MQVGFEQVSGLWIFLAAAMAAGWTIDLTSSALKMWRRRREANGDGASSDDDGKDAGVPKRTGLSADADDGAYPSHAHALPAQ